MCTCLYHKVIGNLSSPVLCPYRNVTFGGAGGHTADTVNVWLLSGLRWTGARMSKVSVDTMIAGGED